MPVVSNEFGVWDLARFCMWCLIVWGVANAVFRSYPAGALKTWLWASQKNRREIQILQWEIQNRMAYDENFARGDTLVKPSALSPGEVSARQERIIELARESRWRRLVNYLLGCAFCQHSWTALVLLLCLSPRPVSFWAGVVPSVFAYTSAVTLVLGRQTLLPGAPPRQSPPKPGGCSSCGKR